MRIAGVRRRAWPHATANFTPGRQQVLKHLERLMLRPPIPGVEAAAAQLLLDWSFLFG